VEFAPHNWYVSVYLRTGLVGLLAYLATLVGLVIRSVRAVRWEGTAKVSILTAIVVFCGGYSWPWYTAPFFGWSVNPPERRLAVREPARPTAADRTHARGS
jgi:O-antigen ligase